MSRLLITGGAGFIGSNLARAATARDHDVVVLDDLSTGYVDNLDDVNVEFVKGSLLDHETVDFALVGVTSVVHLGALGSVPRSVKDPLASHAANATGSLTLLERARRASVSHVVTASSSSVYGLNTALPKQERSWVRPMSPYAVSKLAAEQYTLSFQQSYGMSTLAFRLFNVYGPGQRAGHTYAAVIPVFIDRLRQGQPLPVNGDGQQSRDFTYVSTVTDILMSAVERGVTHPEPVNLAFGTNTAVNTLVDQLAELVGHPVERSYQPARAGDVQHSSADNTTLQMLFPDVMAVPLDVGLAKTLEWFRRFDV